MSNKIKIACPHELGQTENTGVTVSDYHPLTKPEIANLLTVAANNPKDVSIVSGVQVRLNQGIVGMTCPRPIRGKVSEKMNEMDNLFMKVCTEGPSPNTVEKLHKIMTK